jgi:hypothetical protein
MRRFLLTSLTTAVALALAAPAALADTSTSSNWSGYAVHRSGVNFSRVSATWKQPSARCSAGNQTYSAVWVGLGGYSQNSNALEQIGTEVDCTGSGRVSSSAWYELVPAASQPISLRVRPGDSMAASVTVSGHRVTMHLEDLSSHRVYQRTLRAPSTDTASAEWIVEAPSDCFSANSCQTLPLSDFGSARFNLARAQTTTGHIGTISDRGWDQTKINLASGGRQFVAYNGSRPALGVATPSGLSSGGSSFKVTFSSIAAQGPFATARQASLRSGYLVHPGR